MWNLPTSSISGDKPAVRPSLYGPLSDAADGPDRRYAARRLQGVRARPGGRPGGRLGVRRARARASREEERRAVPQAAPVRRDRRRRGGRVGRRRRRARRDRARHDRARRRPLRGRLALRRLHHDPADPRGGRARVRRARPARRVAAPVRRDGRRHARADRARSRTRTCAALLDSFFGEGSPEWERWRAAPAAKHYHQAYRHGLARALPVGRPGGERPVGDVSRHRPRRRGHRRAAARHRQDRGLRAGGRRRSR